MRRFCCVIALLISLCILLCSCSSGNNSVSNAENDITVSVTKETENTDYAEAEILSTVDFSEQSSTTEDTSKSKQNSSAKSEKSSNKETKKNNSATSKASGTTAVTTSKTDTKSAENNSAIPEKNQETSVGIATTEAKEEKTTSSYSQITCDVKIECGVILDNMDNLKAGHSSYVPSDGIILDTYTVTVPSGSTAYDVLEKACSDNNIKLNAQKTAYGVYVAGINNIDEKDCGKSSGWIYSVNDAFPQKSCGLYKLSNGDRVVFSYTC
ncbi:MAG: DUF4430 domain-containing protein [Eubacterium sp.]